MYCNSSLKYSRQKNTQILLLRQLGTISIVIEKTIWVVKISFSSCNAVWCVAQDFSTFLIAYGLSLKSLPLYGF